MRPRRLTLGLLLLLAPAAHADEPAIPTLAIGAQAPDFDLEGVDGKRHTLKDFADAKVLAVVFTCNHCPTAQAYEGRLKALADDTKGKGVALVAINPNDENSLRLDELGYTDLGDSFADMKVRAEHQKFNFPYLYEGDKTGIARAYGPSATPEIFIFDADRKLRYVGRIDDSERESLVKTRDARDAIDALLAGNEVRVAKTAAFGCSTKWATKAESVKQFNAKVAAEAVTVEPADKDALIALRRNETKKVRLVNFWATWCGPCIEELPALVEINRMYRGRAFEFVTVAANFPDEKADVLEILKKNQCSNKNLMFASEMKYPLMEAFDPKWNAALPYTVLFAPGGEVLSKKQGPLDALELKRAIVKALREVRP